MRMLLLTAATAAALASALMAAQAQEGDRSEQAPAAGAIQPRAVKTQSFRPAAQPDQASTKLSTDSRANETAAADRPTVRQPSTPRRMVRAQRQRVAERHRPRPAQQRALRTRKPTTTTTTTTGQATQRVSREALPSRPRPRYARAADVAPRYVAPRYVAPRYVEPRAAGTAGRIALTEPQVARLNAAFTDYIVRQNVWTRPAWEFTATVGATVPGWVQVYGVPAEIVAIYPEFAGGAFMVVGDDIVVLEPGSRRIVAMISRVSNTAVLEGYEAVSTTGLAPPAEERVRLTRAQIAVIRTVARDPACRYERPADFFIGSLVPAAAPVCAFPERVIAAVPDIADYRYITRRNAIVVVDPGNDRVVTVIR